MDDLLLLYNFLGLDMSLNLFDIYLANVFIYYCLNLCALS